MKVETLALVLSPSWSSADLRVRCCYCERTLPKCESQNSLRISLADHMMDAHRRQLFFGGRRTTTLSAERDRIRRLKKERRQA